MPRVAEVLRGRLFRFVAACSLAFAVVAACVSNPLLILFLNGLAISVAAGVCIAYMPAFAAAMPARVPTRADLLAAGIFFVSLSVVGMRSLSVIARDLGWPDVYNSTWMPTTIYVGLLGGLLHLWAPNAVEGRLPRERWVSTGIVVAIGVFIVFVLWDRHMNAPHPAIQLR